MSPRGRSEVYSLIMFHYRLSKYVVFGRQKPVSLCGWPGFIIGQLGVVSSIHFRPRNYREKKKNKKEKKKKEWAW